MNSRMQPARAAELPAPSLGVGGELSQRNTSTEPPAIVGEAEAYLNRKRRRWGIGLGAFTLALPPLAMLSPLVLPASLFLGAAAATGASVFLPPGFRTLWAKRVLRRWEEIQMTQSLPGPGEERDPRLSVAELIVARICAASAVDGDAQLRVRRILDHIRKATQDLQIAAMLEEVDPAPLSRKHSRELAEGRLEAHLRQLDELLHVVIKHEETGETQDRADLDEILTRLLAEYDVERMLGSRTSD